MKTYFMWRDNTIIYAREREKGGGERGREEKKLPDKGINDAKHSEKKIEENGT